VIDRIQAEADRVELSLGRDLEGKAHDDECRLSSCSIRLVIVPAAAGVKQTPAA
jgi:hypothetical protein